MMATPGGLHRLGRVLDGKYRIVALLDESPSHVVYRAEHTAIRRAVEIRTLPDGISANGREAERLYYESRISGASAHRNIQSVVDSGTDENGRPFIVYEEISGRTLASILAETENTGAQPGLGLRRGVDLLMQLTEAICAMHRAGIVHRGLRPECVKVIAISSGAELVKLGGFDFAEFIAESAAAVPVPNDGSVSGVPPEMVCEPRRVDVRSDVYSLGVLLRLVLTGNGATVADSENARRAIERAVAIDPEERFATAEQFAHALSLLVPEVVQSLGPAFGQQEPANPLASDLRYLQLRRTTRASMRAELSKDARVDWLFMLLAIEAIFHRAGQEGWERVRTRAPEAETILPAAGGAELYQEAGVPIRVANHVLAVADDELGLNDLSFLAEIGARVAARGLDRIAPELAGEINPDRIVRVFPEIWARIARQGHVLLLDLNESSARLAIRGQIAPSLELCATASGFLRGALVATQWKSCEVYATACQALGDSSCIYRLAWQK